MILKVLFGSEKDDAKLGIVESKILMRTKRKEAKYLVCFFARVLK
jgi:hypothetical protein